ncbi:MAG: hypothetical protein ACRC1K_15575 [Planctomycetia bacterium]
MAFKTGSSDDRPVPAPPAKGGLGLADWLAALRRPESGVDGLLKRLQNDDGRAERRGDVRPAANLQLHELLPAVDRWPAAHRPEDPAAE